MIQLKRLNVVKQVETEEEAQLLMEKGFKRLPKEKPKPRKGAGVDGTGSPAKDNGNSNQ